MLWVLIRIASVRYSLESPRLTEAILMSTHLAEAILMSIHNICFYGENNENCPQIILKYPPYLVYCDFSLTIVLKIN